MMNFLKSFLSNEKTAEEKNLEAAHLVRDVILIDGAAEDETPPATSCGALPAEGYAEEEYAADYSGGGCGGCGCRR